MAVGTEDLQMLPILRALHQVCRPRLLPGWGDQVSFFMLLVSCIYGPLCCKNSLITTVPEGWFVLSLLEIWVRFSLRNIIYKYDYCFSLFASNLKVAASELSLPHGSQWLNPNASTKHFGPPSSSLNYFKSLNNQKINDDAAVLFRRNWSSDNGFAHTKSLRNWDRVLFAFDFWYWILN